MNYLPVSAVAEIAYCPRNFYYRVVQQWQNENYHVLKGRLQDEKRAQREKLYRPEGVQVRSVMAASDSLGLIAVIDALQEGTELVPIEYKTGSLRQSLHDDVQLCAEAMILEEVTKRRVRRGHIYYANSRARRKVSFTPRLRQRVHDLLSRAWDIMESGRVPDPVADQRCRGCALAPICLPEEVAFLKRRAPAPSKPTPAIDLGRVLYVDEQGAYVGKQGGCLRITKKRELLARVPAVDIDQLVLVGAVQISTQAVRWLLSMNVEVIYLTRYGRFQGQFVPEVSKNSALRLAQFQAHQSTRRCLTFAKAFVQGKIANMRTILLRRNRELNDSAIKHTAERLAQFMRASAKADGTQSLLGIEGQATREYFAMFSRLLAGSDMLFEFTKRTRRPPRDPTNALLSFAYSMLTSDAVTACLMAGLDPYIGLYHREKYGRPALALDLIEEFRPIIADSVVFTLINKQMVRPGDFEQRLGGWFLKEKGRDAFFRAYSQRRRTEVTHPLFGYRLPYHRTLELQSRFLAKVLTGELPEYVPFQVR